jgi:hypothetical protein
MSPELIDPELFGFVNGRRAEPSDCYALGMVMYEVLSGCVPFDPQLRDYHIRIKILRGERPERPQGAAGRWFTDEIWDLLELCWKHEPSDRPSARDIRKSLRVASKSWTPSSSPFTTSQQVAGLPGGNSFDLSVVSVAEVQIHPRISPQSL